MRNWNCAIKFIVCFSAAIALAACGSSSDSTTSSVGGAGSTGGNAAAGDQGTGGAVATTGGSNAAGGAIATTGGTPATGGAIATTGGSNATGGTSATSATGGLAATGGAATTAVAATMCDNVCALLATRNPALACVPADCVTTCNSTYTKLAAAKTTCSNAYVALYECGLSQPASSWTCFPSVNIPIPPTAATDAGATCGTEYNTLYTAITSNLATCGVALSS